MRLEANTTWSGEAAYDDRPDALGPKGTFRFTMQIETVRMMSFEAIISDIDSGIPEAARVRGVQGLRWISFRKTYPRPWVANEAGEMVTFRSFVQDQWGVDQAELDQPFSIRYSGVYHRNADAFAGSWSIPAGRGIQKTTGTWRAVPRP